MFYAARCTQLPNLILGAWGCGAFHNPATEVAAAFRKQLEGPDFRGDFDTIIFAIIDPANDGNLAPFTSEIIDLVEKSERGRR